MKTLRRRLQNLLFIALLIAMFSSSSLATSLVISTDLSMSGLLSSSQGTAKISSSFRDDKLVLEARSDAAAFVASDGAIRGARLESALQHIRRTLHNPPYSDEQLAAAILTL
ncbi:MULTISPECIES: DUF2388 domain-containing protein [unclassified Pseudomonas]|uniref:DUF2388 domain-containing protein n=1 Tax=unclassified Pseudomonas TaxID=196821 RepID=UPI0005FCADAC|nr:DUF2388 domain-containing protein [Pseudomonas sp. St29]BAQ80780.1 uncharacterized protein PST29_2891 [Pseudomonas sp. St29]